MDHRHTINRRRFLTAGAATAAFLASPGRALGANDAISVGVIGLGARGRHLLHRLESRPDLRVTALCDPAGTPRSRARSYRDWRDLVEAPSVDAVVIATPDDWHAPMTLAALAAGKDVYCERPMAMGADDADAVCDAARTAGRIVQVGTEAASHPGWRVGRIIAHSGRLGRFTRIFAGYDPSPFSLGWLHDQFTVSMLATGPYAPTCIRVLSQCPASSREGLPSSAIVTAEFAPGHELVVVFSPASRRTPRPAVVRGEHATMEVGDGLVRIVPEDPAEEELRVRLDHSGDHLGDWLDAVHTRETPSCGPELARAAAVATAMAADALRSPAGYSVRNAGR